MRVSGQRVLGDVFAPADVLTVDVRLRLSALLAVPGTAPAILPGQLAALPLSADRDGRIAVRDAIDAGLGAPGLAALAGCRLNAVVPLLAGHDEAAVTRFVPSQLRLPLAQHCGGIAFATLTIEQISGWPGFGSRRVARLVVAAVEAGLELVEAAIADTGPPEVRSAAGRMLAAHASEPERCVAFLAEALGAAGDERDRGVFEHRMLSLGSPVTTAELSAAIGVGAERVRQLAVRALARVDVALDDAPPVVSQMAGTIAERLGAAAPSAAVDTLLESLGLPALPDSRSRLLLRMAGPYRAVDGHSGWVAVDPAELIAETDRMIHEDGGVRLAEHVAKELETLGMAVEHVDGWLAGQPVRSTDGLVVATTGAPGDVAERALSACGRPMVMEEMATWVPGGWNEVEALWLVKDRRFVVTESDALALAEWGDAGDTAGSAGPSDLRAGTLWFEVDRAVLAGGSAPVSLALVHALGLGRGARRTFSTRYGPVDLAYDADVPIRGSIRPVALAVGAAIGDELLITLYPHGHDGGVELIPRSPVGI